MAEPDLCATACGKFTSDESSRIELVSGTLVCSYCPKWQLECLERDRVANNILNIANADVKRARIQNIPNSLERSRMTNVVRAKLGYPPKTIA
jgi:hypothetical protein